MDPDKSSRPIAIVGLSTLFAGSDDVTSFWRDVLLARDRITDVPPSHWLVEDYYDPDPTAPDKTYCKRGAFLHPVAFDPLAFGVPPNAVPATDTAQLLALIAARRVLDDAARTRTAAVDPDRISVILGVASTTELVVEMGARMQRPIWQKALREAGLPESQVLDVCQRIADHYVPWQESTFPGLLGNVVAGRVANRLDLGGTNFVTDAACASSLSALQAGLSELYLGDSDLVITGGVDALNDIVMYMCFSKTPAFSPTGDCRPFSAAADGTVLGEGVGMVALRRLEDAERDGDAVYAVVRGLGASSDGRASSVYAPRPEGQAKALQRAYARAGYSPASVELVEAHGTATAAGDAAEIRSLVSVFGPEAPGRRQWCALGSIKSQLGHTKAAAGAAGLIKTTLALHHRVLPPTLKVERPNPALELASSPFYLNTGARPWIHGAATPRRASVSSFGFGGSNFHVTLEEYRGPGTRAPRLRALSEELVLLSAESPQALVERLRDTARRARGATSPARLACEGSARFRAGDPARAALVAADAEELAGLADRAVDAIVEDRAAELNHPDIALGFGPAAPGMLAFLFPGQGSQRVGMGAALAMAFDAARSIWDDAGEPLAEVVFPPPAFTAAQRREQEEQLRHVAQPAVAAASLAQLALLERLGVQPGAVAGHSFGEVTALAAAGALDRATLVPVARRRGELMAEAAAHAPGGMLAVSVGLARVRELLDLERLELVVANDNAPEQVVLAGPTTSIRRARDLLAAARVVGVELPVASAFHSPAVASSCAPFCEYLAALPVSSPTLLAYGNSQAAPYPSEPAEIRRLLAEQLGQQVRFREMIDRMLEDGVHTFVEVGPGRVLTGLVERCLGGREGNAVALDEPGGESSLRPFWRGLGRLGASGRALDLDALFADYAEPEAPAAVPDHAILITGTNVGRPYPPAGGATALPPPNPERPASHAPTPNPERPASHAPAPPSHTPAPSYPPPPADLSDRLPSDPVAPDAAASHLEVALVQLQRETFEAHRQYQELMAESHRSFLAMASESMALLAGVPDKARSATAQPLVQDAWVAGREPAFEEHTPPAPVLQPTTLDPVVAAPCAELASVEPAVIEPVDLRATLLAIVADKTGYPPELLDLDTELEAGLGIDSIKQVEILAALQDRLPGLPEVSPAELAELRSLRQVANHLARDIDLEAPAEPDRGQDLRRLSPAIAAQPSPGFALYAVTAGRPIYVTDEHPDLARDIAAALCARDMDALVVTDPPEDATAVVCLAAMAGASSSSSLVVHQRALAAARTVARHPMAIERLLVTVQSTGGDFGLRSDPGDGAWSAGVAGIAKTAALEWPAASVKAIDVANLEAAPDQIAGELVTGGPEIEVGFSLAGERQVVRLEPRAPAAASPPVPPGSVVVVSGGGRGITAESAAAMARAFGVRLLLLGRTDPEPWPVGLPETSDPVALVEALAGQGESAAPAELRARAMGLAARAELRRTLAGLEAAGVEAIYETVDVSDAEGVGRALARVRQSWGPIAGLVHGAGVLADKRIADLGDDRLERVFRTKVDGLAALLAATRDDPLSFIALFSSVAARTGNPGQAAYAAANEVLNKVAVAEAHRRGDRCRVRAYNWGPWDGGMVDASLKAHFERQGVALIRSAIGARAFADDLTEEDGAVERLVLAGWAAPETETALAVRLDPAALPQLGDHMIQGRYVLPVAQVADWALRLAQSLQPAGPLCLHDLAVLSGITFRPGDEPPLLCVEASGSLTKGALAVTFRDREDRERYRARIVADADETAAAASDLDELEPWPWSMDQAYGRILFHGPRFRGLAELEGVSVAGGRALLASAATLAWPHAFEHVHPALLDSALQLGVLWSQWRAGVGALPQRIGTVRLHAPADPEAALRCAFWVKAHEPKRVDFDFILSDMHDRVVAEIRDAEFYAVDSPLVDSSPARDTSA